MLKYVTAAAAAACLFSSAAHAQSSFQYSCSNYGFAYSGSNPVLNATCLSGNGTPTSTSLVLTGIVVVNGVLTNLNSGVPSNFQTNCGSINIYAEGPYVMLAATCATNNGQQNETSIQLDNISNNHGQLMQGH
jgi:hypothetical protein